MVHFADVSDIIQNFQLTTELRQSLESFALTLSIIVGDDVKVAREAQMMHSMQLAFGKADIVGSSSNTDTITLSLVLHHIVSLSHKKLEIDIDCADALSSGDYRCGDSVSCCTVCRDVQMVILDACSLLYATATRCLAVLITKFTFLCLALESFCNRQGMECLDMHLNTAHIEFSFHVS